MHITRGGPSHQKDIEHGYIIGTVKSCIWMVTHGCQVQVKWGGESFLFSAPRDPPMHISLVWLLFHVIFLNPQNRKSFKKNKHIKHANTWIQQANNEMWTLSNFTLPGWHQYTETGSRKKFLTSHTMCVLEQVCVCECVCECVCTHVCKKECEWFNNVWFFSLLLSICFFFLIGQMFICC